MPRRKRINLIGMPQHIVQRGSNRSQCFFVRHDFGAYLNYLGESANRYRCALHAYVLMSNHVHLLATPHSNAGISRMMQRLAGRYARYINDRYERTGPLWEGRFRSSLVATDKYVLACYRYVELNPTRAGIVKDPADYAWSSYRHNALGHPSNLVSHHPTYLALGRSAQSRRSAYLSLFQERLGDPIVEVIRNNTYRSAPIGWQTGSDPDFGV